MSFREYIFKAKITDDPRGDFISDARDDSGFPEVSSFDELESYIGWKCRYDPDVMRAARQAWQSYEKTKKVRRTK